MGLRGRKPVPTVLKIIRGNPGKRRINKSEPQPAGGLPECPGTLEPAAKLEWEAVVRSMPENLFRSVDAGTLALYCQSYARWKDAETAISESGMVLVTRDDKGGVKGTCVSPFVNASHKYRDAMLRSAAELGFTPSSRSRLNPQEKGSSSGDEWDDL